MKINKNDSITLVPRASGCMYLKLKPVSLSVWARNYQILFSEPFLSHICFSVDG